MRFSTGCILAVVLQSSICLNNAFTFKPQTYSPKNSISSSGAKSRGQQIIKTEMYWNSPVCSERRNVILMAVNDVDDNDSPNEGKVTTKVSIETVKEKLRMISKKEDENDKSSNTAKNDEIEKTTTNASSSSSPKEGVGKFIDDLTPPEVMIFMKILSSKLKNVKIVVLSFIAGSIITGGVIFIPVYNQVTTLSEPVALFETVLSEIGRGYVDEVDTNRMFETGMNAMLRSLDPYTEFEGKSEAAALNESIDGKYGGVGLVISGATPKDLEKIKKEESRKLSSTATPSDDSGSDLSPKKAIKDRDNSNSGESLDEDDDDQDASIRNAERKLLERVRNQGIRVVSAFEGYAYDYGMRVGDKLVAINNKPVTLETTVEYVRNNLRGEPGTSVDISFEREGVEGVQTITMPRKEVKIRDVKLAKLMGNKADGIGYIQLTGFSQDAGREMRSAITALQRQALEASNGERPLQGLVLDMRGNPGGLLTSAVDVASLVVPKDSDIVSAKGRDFAAVRYVSRVDPIVDPSTKLAILVNGGTASAAEIVTGAVQDLDVGIVVGADRTFGKGLVQNVEELPFQTALKFTVAKYYTPSGRCIQGINYKSGGGSSESGGKYTAEKIAAKDRTVFFTKGGRQVKDGGGIEADYKVATPKLSALEITLLRSGIISDFATQWSRNHVLTNNFEVDDKTYRDFQNFVQEKQKEGDIELEALYSGPLNDLRRALKSSGYKGSSRDLQNLQAGIIKEIQRDFDKYRADIKEDIGQGILARYLPESMLLEKSLETDDQVKAAVNLVKDDQQFKTLLVKGSTNAKEATSLSDSTKKMSSNLAKR